MRARERKSSRPKVIAENPGLRNLALHLAEKRKRKAAGNKKENDRKAT